MTHVISFALGVIIGMMSCRKC
uniref:Uncharacterized protein, isoform A n=1 Tax=Drosophila melanogaster TaxID=7227 RepID=A0A0B4LF48_DROME|nr:uncharacterized protein Dmel_CG43178, isoform A [Drosophila melanogaster]NP_001286285.1 uncharacterized protein Dmel_CG43178, isoform B [Drosophila melanogaster]NP_001303340.1 uncharacterized protein Dmel_CG43178, isoform C [Drosophila melanogaster]AFH08002.1 uncharacterized protein Dmel_CG43171, isoform A [Drosophila melanogaster]AHN56083.1 uncharacterized protein Dmel_CG43171, isoform B [Drosophila melanogaster]ALI30170.1 uncharacterized protein Dmel_CG43171, isoform C [Drosophila melanog|eukprot:NP_001246247.1 uncharacterized protein Dmel_CG43178, isoform A [Drosophila melanogaster]